MITRYHNYSLLLFAATFCSLPFFCFGGHKILILLTAVFWVNACLYNLFAKQQSPWWVILAFLAPFGILLVLFIEDRADRRTFASGATWWAGLKDGVLEIAFLAATLTLALIINSMYFTYVRKTCDVGLWNDALVLGLEMTGLFTLIGIAYQARIRIGLSISGKPV